MKMLYLAVISWCGVLMTQTAMGQFNAVIQDPDGYTNVRAQQTKDSKIIAKVREGEVFECYDSEGSPWWRVTLKSGASGWMYYDRIRFYYSKADLPKGDDGSEIDIYARSKGFDYSKLIADAVDGKPAALKKFFSLEDVDGAAAESHYYFVNVVAHLLGDEDLAEFLKSQSKETQTNVREQLCSELTLWPFEPTGYMKRAFPLSSKILLKN